MARLASACVLIHSCKMPKESETTGLSDGWKWRLVTDRDRVVASTTIPRQHSVARVKTILTGARRRPRSARYKLRCWQAVQLLHILWMTGWVIAFSVICNNFPFDRCLRQIDALAHPLLSASNTLRRDGMTCNLVLLHVIKRREIKCTVTNMVLCCVINWLIGWSRPVGK